MTKRTTVDTTQPEPTPPPAVKADFPDGSTGETFTVVADDTPILAALIAEWNADGPVRRPVVDA